MKFKDMPYTRPDMEKVKKFLKKQKKKLGVLIWLLNKLK